MSPKHKDILSKERMSVYDLQGLKINKNLMKLLKKSVRGKVLSGDIKRQKNTTSNLK